MKTIKDKVVRAAKTVGGAVVAVLEECGQNPFWIFYVFGTLFGGDE
jgi:hypothetical protein